MSYEEVIGDVVRVVEAVGCAVMVLGALWAFVTFAIALVSRRRGDSYSALRRDLGRVILLGLEILIIADIIRTVIVDPSLESVMVLGLIVLIRIILSFSLEVEIDGTWPWSRWKLAGAGAGAGARQTPEGTDTEPAGADQAPIR